MIFGCQSSIIHISVDIHIDIQARISMQGHSAMDTSKQMIRYPCLSGYQSSFIHDFMDISLQLSMLYGYPLGYP